MAMIYDTNLQHRMATHVMLLFDAPHDELIYHNLHHTQQVVKRCKEIAAHYPLNETELFVVIAAACFHDCGHLTGPFLQHEERSVAAMRKYLAAEGVEENILQLIEACILATRFPYKPASLTAEILCDADSYHLGTREFAASDDLVKKEFDMRNGFVPADWNKMTLDLLEKHQFFTSYCRSLLNEGKQKNIAVVRAKIRNNIG